MRPQNASVWDNTLVCSWCNSIMRCQCLACCFGPWLLEEFHQHVASLYVSHCINCCPYGIAHGVQIVHWTVSKPPPSSALAGTAARACVVVAVWGAEHLPVGAVESIVCPSESITGVPGVPDHRQSIPASLITDGERRVFSHVPQTRSTMELRTHKNYYTGFIILLPRDAL